MCRQVPNGRYTTDSWDWKNILLDEKTETYQIWDNLIIAEHQAKSYEEKIWTLQKPLQYHVCLSVQVNAGQWGVLVLDNFHLILAEIWFTWMFALMAYRVVRKHIKNWTGSLPRLSFHHPYKLNNCKQTSLKIKIIIIIQEKQTFIPFMFIIHK